MKAEINRAYKEFAAGTCRDFYERVRERSRADLADGLALGKLSRTFRRLSRSQLYSLARLLLVLLLN